MEQNKFEIVLKLLIGNRSINQTARESGVAKANISRLLNGEYQKRPSAKQLYKLTAHEASPQNGIDFPMVMNAAGYSETEIEKFLHSQGVVAEKYSILETEAIKSIQHHMVENGASFRSETYEVGKIHGVMYHLDGSDIKTWIILFALSDSLLNVLGYCALLPFDPDRKVSILTKENMHFSYGGNSLSGNFSILCMGDQMNLKDEIHLIYVKGKIITMGGYENG